MRAPSVSRPLLPVTLCYMLGIVLGLQQPGSLATAGGVLLLGLAACGYCLLRRASAFWAVSVVFLALGYLAIQPWLVTEFPPDHVNRFVDQGRLRLHGVVAGPPRAKAGRLGLLVTSERISISGTGQEVRGKVQVTVRGIVPALRRGDRIEVEGYLHAIRNFNNPGGFDYERYMALQGIHVRLSTQGERVRVVTRGAARSWLTDLDRLRERLGRRMDAALANHKPATGAVLKALVIGDRSAVTPGLRDRFNRAGVGHLLAISGLHIGMVAAGVFFLSLRLLSRVPSLLHRGWTRKGAALAAMAAVAAYALLSGLSPSTQRAGVMVEVFLLTYWIGRRYDWLNAAAVAALIILVAHPPSVASISFQLSFAAVVTILLGLPYLPASPPMVQTAMIRNALRRIPLSVGVSVLAVAGTLPLIMTSFNQVSLVGPAANLVVVPVAGWLVIPLGLAGVAVSAASPALAYLCWQGAGFVLDGILALVAWIAHWPLAAVNTFTPSLLETLLYFGLLALVLNWRRVPLRSLALGLILAVFAADSAYWFYQRHGRRDARLTVLDVGQGSCNLLELPGGRTVLVDGGGFSDNSVFDVGRSLVAPYLWRSKITTVDLVVLSHPNSDHYNGLTYILGHFHIGEIWSNHEAAPTKGYRQFLQMIHQQAIPHPSFAHLPRREKRWGATFELLAPEPGFLRRRKVESWRDENEDSLVLRVRTGGTAILFCGDIGMQTEKRLVHRIGKEELESTILLIPHHGSRHSACRTFLEAVNPAEAVISCGWRNRYGFPHKEVLKSLDRLGCGLWRTDRNGAIRFFLNGYKCKVQPTLR